MCSVYPNSGKTNIYRKLVAAKIPRTSIKRSPSTYNCNIPTPRLAWCSSNNTNTTVRSNNQHTSRNHNDTVRGDPIKEGRNLQMHVHRNNNNSNIGLEIKTKSYDQTKICPGLKIVAPEFRKPETNWKRSPQSEYSNTEVYDDDMISVWSSFDLKSYDLDCRGNNTRAKSAPPRRLPYQCGNATLLYSESRGSSQCSKRDRSHDKLKQVLAETTPKLVKSVHLDYDLYLQALKLEKCVPVGVSDKRIRKDIAMIFKKHNASKFPK